MKLRIKVPVGDGARTVTKVATTDRAGGVRTGVIHDAVFLDLELPPGAEIEYVLENPLEQIAYDMKLPEELG